MSGFNVRQVPCFDVTLFRPADLSETPLKLTGALVQKLEERKKLYDEKHKSHGIFGFFKKIFHFAKTVLNPGNWLKPAFWRDVVIPRILGSIPGIGAVLSRLYQWGLDTYRRLKKRIDL